jgi:hypothetical protein
MPERTHDDNRDETHCVAPASPPRRSKRRSNEDYRTTPRDNLTTRKTPRPVAVVAPKHGAKGVYAAGSPLPSAIGSRRFRRMARHKGTPCPPRSITFALAKRPTMPRLLAAPAQGACYLLPAFWRPACEPIAAARFLINAIATAMPSRSIASTSL